MLQKVEITEPGDTDLIAGEQVDRDEVETINKLTIEEGKNQPSLFLY